MLLFLVLLIVFGVYQQVEPEVRERGLQLLSEFGLSLFGRP